MELQVITFDIEGVQREVYVAFPVTEKPNAPILFAFHGHGGTGKGFGTQKQFEAHWKDCIVVYPTGLPTVSGADQDGSKTGWQHSVGEVNRHTNIQDQDLKLFDKMVEYFSPKIDKRLICLHGWSNGGEFVYDVLWTVRGEQIFILSAASAILNTTQNKKPLSVCHIAGKQDTVVPFTGQQRAFEEIKKLNKFNGQVVEIVTNDPIVQETRYRSHSGTPVAFIQYDGQHNYPDSVPLLMDMFFINRVKRFLSKQ